MPPKSEISIDVLITALSNERVVEAFVKALQPLMQPSIVDALSVEMSKQIEGLKVDINSRDKEIEVLKKENHHLRNAAKQHAIQLEALENYSRIDNVIVHGLPESFAVTASTVSASQQDQQKEDTFATEKIFTEFCRDKLHISITASDISICHRLPGKNKNAPRPVIVRFANRKMKALIMSSRKELKGTKVYINEHLTKSTSDMYATARNLLKAKKLEGAWTSNGRLVIRVKNGDNIETKTVNHPDELDF
jgi:hypothetical protein